MPKKPKNTNYKTKPREIILAKDLELSNRLNEVIRLIVNGGNKQDIIQLSKDLNWGIGERQIDNYISKAKQLIKEEYTDPKSTIIEIALSKFDRIYKLAIEDKNYKEANNAVLNQMKILGIGNNPINFQQNNFVNNQNGISGNAISNNPELIELASKLSLGLSNSEIITDFANVVSD